MDDNDWIDKEGNLKLTYEIMIYCHGKRLMLLGMGGSDTSYFYDIVEKGEVDALNVEYSFGNNVVVTLTGKALIDMIEKHYPDKLTEAKEFINPSEEYTIDCYDMS